MPAFKAKRAFPDSVVQQFAQLGFPGLRARTRADMLTVETDEADPIPLVRFRAVTTQYWSPEFPTSSGKWERTPYRGILRDMITKVATEFPWTLAS